MEVNLEVVVQVASYDPFNVRGAKIKRMEGASTHTPPLCFKEANIKLKLPKEVTSILLQIVCNKI
jgi:hypothetical protein